MNYNNEWRFTVPADTPLLVLQNGKWVEKIGIENNIVKIGHNIYNITRKDWKNSPKMIDIYDLIKLDNLEYLEEIVKQKESL